MARTAYPNVQLQRSTMFLHDHFINTLDSTALKVQAKLTRLAYLQEALARLPEFESNVESTQYETTTSGKRGLRAREEMTAESLQL